MKASETCKKKVFIDGSAGTTGLRIRERLSERDDLELVILEGELRKDPIARKDAIESADIAFLCLPDTAAREVIELVGDCETVIIDTSTAHRTEAGWTYGFPELRGGAQREEIKASKRIANPGCHASGFIALVAPLVEKGLIKPDAALTCFSLTGYSGGGKKMIAQYEADDRSPEPGTPDPGLEAPRQYGLTQQHKHLKEMKYITRLYTAPAFCPIVADFYSGMEVTVPVFAGDVNGTIEDVREAYRQYYDNSKLVTYRDNIDIDGFISASALSGRDNMVITVAGDPERMLLIALFDNLGKGASGAAIQNMNIVMGLEEDTGLTI